MKHLAEVIGMNEAKDSAEMILLKDIIALGKDASTVMGQTFNDRIDEKEWKELLRQLTNITDRVKRLV